MDIFILFFGLLSVDGTVASNSYIVESCDQAMIESKAENEIRLINELQLNGILVHTCQGFNVEDGKKTGAPA